MPEMPGAAGVVCTSAAYRLLAQRVILPWAIQGIQPVGDILEIGAGGGAMAAELVKRFENVNVVATDYDPRMVAAAQRTLDPSADRMTVKQADATDLPFDSDRFFLVLSCAMLHHVVGWERALAEAARVLKPGGRLVGFDLLHTAPLHHSHHHHDDGEAGVTRMLSPEELERELGQLFTDVRIRRSTGGLAMRFLATKAA